GNGTSHAEIDWYVWDFGDVKIADDHNIIVVADPENEIPELNESNNAATWQIHVNAPELTVTSLYFEPDKEKINESERINISVEVANYGDENATDVSLVVYDCANRHIENSDDISVYGSLHPGQDKAQIKKENATAMRLYLDLDIDIDSGKVSIRNGRSGQIELMEGSGVIFKDELSYYENFHGWTPWIIGSNVTIEAMGNASARVSKVYYLEPGEEKINTTYNLSVNRTEEKIIPIFDNWTALTVGERLIVATIDPGNEIQEYNELNNTFARYITNTTKDLAIEDIKLRWLDDDGTLIGADEIIRDNDTVRIAANITNIGVEEVSNFDVRVFGGEEELVNETKYITLMPGKSWLVDEPWTAKVGTQVIKVEVDYNNEINETNETNNINAKEIDVHGAEVSGNTTWESLGLHGEILFDPAQPYEEDDVNISAVINNTGKVNATNFSVALLFDYEPSDPAHKFSDESPKSWDLNYDNATCICLYLNITPTKYQVLAIYDRNSTEVARTDKSCWVHVPGDVAKVEEIVSTSIGYSPGYIVYSIYFYPVYEKNLIYDENLTLNVNSSRNVPIMTKNVTAGNHPVLLLIDPEGNVPEDDKRDNIETREMEVLPTRDFTVVEVIPERTNISDVDRINITANASNAGYRNGTTKVQFVDYENETRIHSYYLNNTLPDCSRLSNNLPYLPVSPGETFSHEYKNLTIIHRPGVDAIQLNFSSITFDDGEQPPPEIYVFNKTGEDVLWANYKKEVRVFNGVSEEYHKLEQTESLLPVVNKNLCPGDTAYIYTINADFRLSGYTTMKEFHETDVTLNASVAWDESGNITEVWCESKNITAPQWNASTGDHNITVIIDPEDETIETNETNNTYVLPLRVNATKELEIVDLNYSVQNPAPGQDPWHPGDGDNVTITAVVRNS
ncbi:hypothetical protein KAW18_18740, partial [candidate division WOR-3 bacterium]|nr:hypothetical protein [candidate division WOR-3 bacterium]